MHVNLAAVRREFSDYFLFTFLFCFISSLAFILFFFPRTRAVGAVSGRAVSWIASHRVPFGLVMHTKMSFAVPIATRIKANLGL